MTADRKVSLLICDDHKILTDALAMVVERDDELILVGPPVHDAESAIALAAEQLPDVVLMDIVFKSGMNGIEATRKIKEVSPSTKVVIMTAHDDERLLVEAVEAGASGFLGKDEAAEEVLAAAKAAADGEVLIDPAILTRLLHQVAREREARSSADAARRPHRSRAGDPPAPGRGPAQRRHREQAVHQPADGADPRPQHPRASCACTPSSRPSPSPSSTAPSPSDPAPLPESGYAPRRPSRPTPVVNRRTQTARAACPPVAEARVHPSPDPGLLRVRRRLSPRRPRPTTRSSVRRTPPSHRSEYRGAGSRKYRRTGMRNRSPEADTSSRRRCGPRPAADS